MPLRYYQKDASDAAFEFIMSCLDPCVIEAATGAGKSLVISDLAKRIHEVSGKKILCTAPSKELVEQNAEKYKATGNKCSIFSASISKSLRHPVVFGTPLTVLNALHRFNDFAAVIMDEAHGITPTMMQIIEQLRVKNPKLRVIGLTATPYRTNTGYIFRHHYQQGRVSDDQTIDPFFHTLVYSIGARELIAQNYLTPPLIGEHAEGYDTSGLIMKSNGKWDESTVEQAFVGRGRLTSQIVADIVAQSHGRMGVLIFAATLQHAAEVMESLPPGNSRCVTGSTSKAQREKNTSDFKAQRFKYLVNVGVYTTGFDAPHVDVVAVLRKTESPGLLQQIIGRGARLHEDKDDFLLLDYAENIEEHFPHGDVFEPVIKVRKPSEGDGSIEAVCELCNHVNHFGARPNPEGYQIDAAGYFTDLAGNRLETPAHFGRRCTGEVLINGIHARCTYKWSCKECPECGEENDIAARYCTACKAEIVDPNEKLREIAAQVASDPYRTRTSAIKAMHIQSWPSRDINKPDTLCITYQLEDYSKDIRQWFSPDSEHSHARNAWAKFSISAFGRIVNRDEAVRLDAVMPDMLIYRKERGSRYFRVVNTIWENQLALSSTPSK